MTWAERTTTETTRRSMGLGTLVAFFAMAFGLGWGVVAILILFTDQVGAIFGPVGYTNPVFILAVWSPGIAGAFLVFMHYGLGGLGSFLRASLSGGCRSPGGRSCWSA